MLKRVGVPFALASLLLLVLLLNKAGVLAPDIKPEIYLAPWREAQALRFAWTESPKLGLPNFNVGLFPVAAVVGLLQGLGFGPDLSMRILRWGLLLLGAWGASRLYDVVAREQAQRWGRIAIAVLYVANPYMIVSGDFLANYLPAALLPWLILFLLRATTTTGWRFPAAGALAFAGMSGMNAAVIPLIQLLCLPAVLWYARVGLGATWRGVLAAMTKWGLLVILLSAYWLVPSLAALGTGNQVTEFSETLQGIAATSSFGEVLRGLGLWTLYGRDLDGAWLPGFVSYLTNPFVVLASFLLPLLMVVSATVTRGPARRLALFMLLPAAILMVGAHQVDQPTPFGRLLLWSFEHLPGAAAFRTTHKVGAVLVLGVALLCALAVPALCQVAARHVPRPAIVGGAIVSMVLATWPAWTNGLYSLPLPVPDYWYQATSALDEGSMNQRVWFVPGVGQPQYTWSESRPDDLNNALLARPSMVRIALPESSPYGASFLAALDTKLQEEALPVGTLSAAARYLGVGDVLVRHDVRWDQAGGARPLSTALAVGADPGLGFRSSHGAPGEGILQTPGQSPAELTLPPLQHYQVNDARDLVRTESSAGLVLVDGDGWAIPALAQAGLLPSEPAFLLTGSTAPADLAAMLGPQSRIVLTDTNRRRDVVPNRLTGAYGALKSADDPLGRSISLFDSDDQTVLRVVGGEVSASQVGSLFGTDAASVAENAFDGDPRTSWRFGHYGQGLGQSISVRLDRAIAVDRIEIDLPPAQGQRVAAIEVTADDEVQEVRIPADGRATVSFPGHRAANITVSVTGLEGEGDNGLALAEVRVPGLEVRRVARLPVSTMQELSELTGDDRDRLAGTPVDVVLSRSFGTPLPDDDEEVRLDRDFTLPSGREYRLYGMVHPDPSAPDQLLDRLQGITGDAVVSSSSRALDSPALRGSRAFDGDPSTGWSPGRAVAGEWLEASFTEPRVLSEVVIEQPEDASAWISGAELLVDGRLVATTDLAPGRTAIRIPESEAASLRVRITDVQGGHLPVITEIEAAGVRVATEPAASDGACVQIGTLNGSPLTARVIGDIEGDGPRLIQGCERLSLAAGEHQLRSTSGWVSDALVLRDSIGEMAQPGQSGAALAVTKESASAYRILAEPAMEPYLLVVGQNWHPAWRATMDGVDLGTPVVVDGYALGWWVDNLERHVFDVEYSPQAPSDVALIVSGGAVVLSTALVALPPHLLRGPAAPATATRAGPAARRAPRVGRYRTIGRWLLLVLGCWFFAGPVGLVAGGLVAIWCLLRDPSPHLLLRLSALAMGLAPVAWIGGNLARWGEVGPALVTENPAPSLLVVLSLVLLVVGVLRDDSRATRSQ